MLKKMTALILILAFNQSFAMTPAQEAKTFTSELNRSFDDLNFKVNVEWDQKDGNFFDQSITDFENDIAELQREGLTSENLVKHALGKIKDKNELQDIGRMAKVTETMSPDEARDFVISKLSKTYAQGASYHGGVVKASIYGVAAIICVLIYTNATHKTKSESDVNVRFPQIDPYLPPVI